MPDHQTVRLWSSVPALQGIRHFSREEPLANACLEQEETEG